MAPLSSFPLLPNSEPGALGASPSRRVDEFARSWKVLLTAIAGTVLCVSGLPTYAIGVYLNPMAAEMGWSTSEMSGWATCLWIATILFSPLAGFAADRFGARKLVLGGIPLYALSVFSVALIHGQVWRLYVSAFMVGACGTLAGLIIYLRVVTGWFQAGRGLALGLTSAGVGLSAALAPRLNQAVVDRFGWRVGFMSMAGLILLLLPVAGLFLRERRDTRMHQAEPETGRSLAEASHRPAFWLISLAGLFHMAAIGAGLFYLVPYLTSTGLSRSIAATYAGILGVTTVAGRIGSGFLFDRFNAGLVCMSLFLLVSFGFSLLAVWHGVGAVYAIALIGLGHGGEVAGSSYCTVYYFGLKSFGRISGVLMVPASLGFAVGPLLFGQLQLATKSYTLPYLALAALAVISATFYALVSRQRPAESDRAAS